MNIEIKFKKDNEGTLFEDVIEIRSIDFVMTNISYLKYDYIDEKLFNNDEIEYIKIINL